MMKLKYLLLSLTLSIVAISCKDDDPEVTPFDHKAQALKDNDSLIKFFKSHYFDTTTKSIKPVNGNITSLIDDPKLITKQVTLNDVDYKLYSYVYTEGIDPLAKGKPTFVDSVFVNYEGQTLKENTLNEKKIDLGKNTWLDLGNGTIKGMSYSLINFKPGKNTSQPNRPINFEGQGKGFIFIPSGLGYREKANSSIPANSILVFHVDLCDFIKDTDHDNDGIPSILEDLNNDSNILNDDTDGDNKPNFIDSDDDNDLVPTKKEDRNKDGNPANDFNDPNNPTLPDYLNPDLIG